MTTILVVDDMPTNLKVLSESIVESGWTILVAIDGESAIEQAIVTQPDLILLDVMMPGIDGFETCHRLKQEPATQDIPVIFMTALADAVDKVKGLQLGAVDYITKPFQAAEAIARIQVHLRLQELNQALGQQNIELERRVAERTAELKTALDRLEQSQLQLIQTARMSTLGELAAGAIHELKNQISILVGNLPVVETYAHDLLDHLQYYRAALPPEQLPSTVKQHAQRIDLPFLLKDFPHAIHASASTAERLRSMVTAVLTFSYRDAQTPILFDVHQGLDSTLMLLKHRLKGNPYRPPIEIRRQYGELVPIACFPGQLNQVFLNLLSNAIDAIEEANHSRNFDEMVATPNQIEVRTTLVSRIDSSPLSPQDLHIEPPETGPVVRNTLAPQINPPPPSAFPAPPAAWVRIVIADNGIGIPERVRQMLFSRSFTTKPVGKGTGLGLPISRHIIEEVHGGRLSCRTLSGLEPPPSEPASRSPHDRLAEPQPHHASIPPHTGTEFQIDLPVP
jgi:signal transduction histidine kinase